MLQTWQATANNKPVKHVQPANLPSITFSRMCTCSTVGLQGLTHLLAKHRKLVALGWACRPETEHGRLAEMMPLWIDMPSEQLLPSRVTILPAVGGIHLVRPACNQLKRIAQVNNKRIKLLQHIHTTHTGRYRCILCMYMCIYIYICIYTFA